MRILGPVLAVTTVFLATSSASADATEPMAVLTNPQGKVLVDQGNGYVPAVAGMALAAKNRIFVGEKSGAVVTYQDCALVLEATTMFDVPKTVPCESGTQAHLGKGPIVTPAGSSLVSATGFSGMHWFGISYFGAVLTTAVYYTASKT